MIEKTTKILLVFFIITCIFPQSVFSQTFSKKINWQSKRQIKSLDEIKYIFNFDNSGLFDSGLLPHYSENIDLNNIYSPNHIYKVKLEKAQFIAFKSNEIIGVEDINKVLGSIEIQSYIVFDRGKPYLNVNFIPIRKNESTRELEKLVSFNLIIEKEKISSSKNRKINVTSSVLSSGTWKKIRISESGIYKLTFDEIQNMGFSNPQNIRIFGNDAGWLPMIAGDERPDDLIENDVIIQDNSVIFFAHGPIRWEFNETTGTFEPIYHYYSGYVYYYLTTDYNSGYNNVIKSINSDSQTETHSVNTFNFYSFHNVDNINIAETGRRWYGESFDINNNQNFNFSIPNLINSSEGQINVCVASTSGNSNFSVSVSGST